MNCNAPLAIFCKRNNVDEKTVFIHASYRSTKKPSNALMNYNCPKPKKCSKDRLTKALKACARHAKGLRNTPRRYRDCVADICMTGNTKWATKEMNAAARNAAMRVGGNSERPAKDCFQIGAKYKDSKSGTYWLVGAFKKATEKKCKCKPTMRRLDGSLRSNKVQVVFRGMNLFKIRVNGPMDAAHIRNACRKKMMKPLCDHRSYKDAHCWPAPGRALHFSYPPHDRIMGMPVSKARGIFFYTGRHGHGSLYNTGTSTTAPRAQDRNQYTMCARKQGAGAATRTGGASTFRYRGKNLYKTRVPGVISAANIRNACGKKGLKPVCCGPWKDGKCWSNGIGMHWSYPPHDRRMGVPVSKVRGLFFYTGRVHTGALYNTGTTHRWARRNSERGYTLCEGHIKIKKKAPPKKTKKQLKKLKKNFMQVRKGVKSVCADPSKAKAARARAAAKKAKAAARRLAAKAAKAKKKAKRMKLLAAAKAAKKAAIAAKKAARAAKKAADAKKAARRAAKAAEKARKDKAAQRKAAAARKKAKRMKLAAKRAALKARKAKQQALNKKPKAKNKRPKDAKSGKGRRRRSSGNKPRFMGDEKQMQKSGGKTRQRHRKGAGRGKGPKGCKVSEKWANAHLTWCSWDSWSSWKG